MSNPDTSAAAPPPTISTEPLAGVPYERWTPEMERWPVSTALLERRDMRTRAGRRAEIIEQVEKHGGFTVFWITENAVRASVGQEMLDRGELVSTRKSGFPWHALRVAVRSNTQAQAAPSETSTDSNDAKS